jgi:stage V sporulation protein B
MRIANLITIPSFVGMWLLATPISQMLYGTPNAGTSIAVMSIGVFLLGIHQVTTGVLQGLGHTAIPVINMGVSAVAKIILSWTLTAMPALGIKGAAWASNADFGLAALLNMYFVYRYVGFGLDVKDTLKTVAASAVMGAVVLITYDAVMAKLLHNSLATLIAIAAGGAVYGAVLLLTGTVEERDLERVPRVGGHLVKLLKGIGLMRR